MISFKLHVNAVGLEETKKLILFAHQTISFQEQIIIIKTKLF